MKQSRALFPALLAMLLGLCVIGCSPQIPDRSTLSTTTPEAPHTKIELKDSDSLETLRQLIATADPTSAESVTQWNYRNSFSGISTKLHQGESADLITRLIGALTDTDQSVPALSDAPWDSENYFPPQEVEVGTKWYQIGDSLYRQTYTLSSDGKQRLPSLARVTSHYGEGVVLQTTDEFWQLLNLVSTYHPWSAYSGSYADGTLKLTHVYPGDEDLTVTVKDLEFGTTDLELKRGNTITFELTAPTDREVTIGIKSAHSDDLLATIDSQTVMLQANTPKTVSLTFDGWAEWGYTLDVSIGNTRLSILFNLS